MFISETETNSLMFSILVKVITLKKKWFFHFVYIFFCMCGDILSSCPLHRKHSIFNSINSNKLNKLHIHRLNNKFINFPWKIAGWALVGTTNKIFQLRTHMLIEMYSKRNAKSIRSDVCKCVLAHNLDSLWRIPEQMNLTNTYICIYMYM